MGVIRIAQYEVGAGSPCFIIAEAGVNHNGSLEQAKRLVDVAVAAGADAVKFQTFKAEKMLTSQAAKANYQKQTTDADESQLDMMRRLELPPQGFAELKAYCDAARIIFMSTPFDEGSADILYELGVPVFKLPSGEVVNHPFLQHVSRKGLPIIMSTGMAHLSEVDHAVRTVLGEGNEQLLLLHCVSNYPADPPDVNLRAMQTMQAAFGLPVGYSDHTLGVEVSLAAVAMGACVIEKHFTLDRTLPGPDHRASLEPAELTTLVSGIRKVESALGHGRKEPAASEADTAAVARRSLVAACDIPPGTVLTERHIAIKRPGTGLPPFLREFVIGRRTKDTIPADAMLRLEHLQ